MDIVFVRESQNGADIVTQIRNALVSRIQIPVNITNKGTETFILPVVPEENPFAKITDVKNYKGLTADYNIPTHQDLHTFEWTSLFPVNKNYSWQHVGSQMNGYDYVDFIADRQSNELPFRLIAYERNTISRTAANILNGQNAYIAPIRFYYDGFVVVNEFEYHPDKVGDIKYRLKLKEFNTDILNMQIDWRQVGVSSVGNLVTRYALKSAGLI